MLDLVVDPLEPHDDVRIVSLHLRKFFRLELCN